MFNNTNRDWEKFGKNDPYFGVIAHDRFKKSLMTDEDKEEFFKSGQDYINSVMQKIKKHIDSSFSINHALEFGCGVGRLVIPLAKIAKRVTGIDVSESMINEAKRNCESRKIHNVYLAKTDDSLSILENNYDFILSYIVFQHIPAKRGEKIFNNLLTHLLDGGIGVFHFIYAQKNPVIRLVFLIKKFIPFTKNFIGFIKKRDFFAPYMQMNLYKLERISSILHRFQINEYYVEHTNHSGFLGVNIYFKKPYLDNSEPKQSNLLDKLFTPP